jgi:hypothetical protein
MKKALLAGLIAMTTGASYAAPHGFQQQIGASELDPSIWDGPVISFTPVTRSDLTPSVDVLYASHNIDGAGDLDFTGSIAPSGPTRISLYEIYRGTSEGVAHQGYYERFPADADWEAIARDYRERAAVEALVRTFGGQDDNAS